jgi:hypothetical protein
VANQTLIVSSSSDLRNEIQNIATGSDFVDGTTTTTIRVKGPKSGGPATYSRLGGTAEIDLTSNSGGWLVAVQIEAFDPNDKPIFNGGGGDGPFTLANSYYNNGLSASGYKSAFKNIIWKNWNVSESAGSALHHHASGGAFDYIGCEFHDIAGGPCVDYWTSRPALDGTNRTAIVERCFFSGSDMGIRWQKGYSGPMIVRSNQFSRESAKNSGYFMRPVGVGGDEDQQAVSYNNSCFIKYTNGTTADVIDAVTASNNAVHVDLNGGGASNIDGIYTQVYGNNCVFITNGSNNGNDIRSHGTNLDLGGNITGQDPKFRNTASGDLSLQATSPAILAGRSLADVTTGFSGSLRDYTFLQGGLEKNPSAPDIGAVVFYQSSDRLRSGLLNDPVKIMIGERDAATGSYPTILRTGDPDFTGRSISQFDDNSTIIFSDNSTVIYPMMLPSGSRYLKNDIANPAYFNPHVDNTNDGMLLGRDVRTIQATGNVRAGISDSHVRFTPGENITPFDETRVYLDNDSRFYATGTTTGSLPGFNQRLSSKTAIVIDTDPKQATDFFFSTGTEPNASGLAEGVNSSLGYYNWSDRRWEIIGSLSTGSNVDILNNNANIRSQGLLACVPAGLANFTGETIADLQGGAKAVLETVGFPQSSYGFPFASRYDATGSQMLDMSNYITAPFLLEKMTLEFSASIGPHVVSTSFFGPQVKTFMLMTQKDVSGSTEPYTESVLIDTNPGTTVGRNIQHGFAKSIVAFGQVSLVYDGTPSEYDRDVNVIVPGTGVRRTPTTGSFKMELVPKTPQKNEFAGLHSFMNSDSRTGASPDREVLPLVGGRSGFDITDGRAFIGGVGGLTTTGSHTFSAIHQEGTSTDLTVQASSEDSISRLSPAVILPSDKLVLCFSNTPSFYPITQFAHDLSNPGSRYERGLADASVVLSPGAGKLTLYGSLLQDNLPKESETNQPLTSDAIHEDLHYDNPVYDQWDVEPYASLTGSYVDNVVTGTMLALNADGAFGDVEAPNVRKVQSSVIAGTAGERGSVQRFVRLTDTKGKLYDSFPPNALDILKAEGVGIYGSNTNSTYLAVGSPNTQFDASQGVDYSWYSRTAYEVIQERAVAQEYGDKIFPVFESDGSSIGNAVVTNDRSVIVFDKSFITLGISSDASQRTDGGTEEAKRAAQKALFGFGRKAGHSVVDYKQRTPSFLLYVFEPQIRGYKYGLAGIFGSSHDARFRRDRYGQFRDMLEQRRNAAILLGGSVEYPVEINFVSQDSTTGGTVSPENTHSQNLDSHASSSIPYKDGEVVDRPDNPDTKLQPLDLEVSLT